MFRLSLNELEADILLDALKIQNEKGSSLYNAYPETAKILAMAIKNLMKYGN